MAAGRRLLRSYAAPCSSEGAVKRILHITPLFFACLGSSFYFFVLVVCLFSHVTLTDQTQFLMIVSFSGGLAGEI